MFAVLEVLRDTIIHHFGTLLRNIKTKDGIVQVGFSVRS
ncbi:MAG: hypothetical protein QOJ42_5092 [Acidobacteriaceae bacterium]|jgi:hypothetical protein|nr:hypothetical protein [Acidobacteriaceae bacterium]